MGLFDKLFGGSTDSTNDADKKEEKTGLPWLDLNEMGQLDEIVERSKTKPQLIFKHSTRCGISRMVIGQFKKDYNLNETEADLYYLDLIAYRDISNRISERFGVVHESPQLLVVKNGVVAKHDSHGGINDMALDAIVK